MYNLSMYFSHIVALVNEICLVQNTDLYSIELLGHRTPMGKLTTNDKCVEIVTPWSAKNRSRCVKYYCEFSTRKRGSHIVVLPS